jgi:hypothetical protein
VNPVSEKILLGRGREIVQVSRPTWEGHLSQVPQHTATRLAFMSEDHHRVRYFVVAELPRTGGPIPPGLIAERLRLSRSQVVTILDDLERNLFFLVRDEQGAVAWAFPVTVEKTPHELTFSTGERLYAA